MIEHVNFSLKFDGGHSALVDAPEHETIRILKHIVTQLEHGRLDGVIHDLNGNIVGEWSLEYE